MGHHSANDYMAHGFCFLWDPVLVWLHVISDIAIGLAYYSIPAAIFYFVYKRRDVPFPSMFVLFGIFIFSCGTTHLLAAYTVYEPIYWHEGIVKAITASVSVVSAFLFIPFLPKAIALPSLTNALEKIKVLNQTLEKQVDELRLFRDLIDQASDSIFVIDPETGRFLDVNAKSCSNLNYGREELLTMHVPDIETFIPDMPSWRARSDEVKNKKHSVREGRQKRKDGTTFPVEVNANYISHEKRDYFVAVVRDITERKKMAEEVFQVKQDWEDTFNTLTDMITVHDKEYNIIHANKAAEEILSLPFMEKISDSKCFKYYHGTDGPPSGCPSCQCLVTGEPSTFELFEPHLQKFIEIRAIPRFDSSRSLIGLIHVVRDISERKRAEERINRQIQKLSALRSIDLTISSSLDVRVTLNVFIEHVVTQLGVDAASVLLLNSRAMILEYAASQGLRTSALRHSHLRIGEGYAGVAALENRIVHISDLRVEDSGFKRLGILEGEDFVTYYGVPLVAKGHVKGVLEIFHRSILQPDDEWFEFLDGLALQAAIAIDNNSLFYDLERSNMDLALAYDSTIEGWSRALDYRDKETEGHSQRVTDLTIRIAREMGMNEEELVHVRRGALLHDIGKMGIPDNILLKPGKLTEEEWTIMRLHPVYSYELLYPIAYLRPALDIPHFHHEKWDGSGYPEGLKGEQIPLSARIFAVVDVWDALRSDRPYRPAWGEEKTKEYIRSLSGIQFDPKVVDIFMNMQFPTDQD